MRHIVILFVLLIATASIAADGSYTTDNSRKLLDECRKGAQFRDSPSTSSQENLMYFGKCTGYIRGVADGYYLAYMAAGNLPAERRLCVPTSVTNGQLMRVVVKYLEDNPSQLEVNASFSTVLALRKSFPCSP